MDTNLTQSKVEKTEQQITVSPQMAASVDAKTICTLLGVMPETERQFLYGMICGMLHSKLRKGA